MIIRLHLRLLCASVYVFVSMCMTAWACICKGWDNDGIRAGAGACV
jgi:hypothetical protein